MDVGGRWFLNNKRQLIDLRPPRVLCVHHVRLFCEGVFVCSCVEVFDCIMCNKWCRSVCSDWAWPPCSSKRLVCLWWHKITCFHSESTFEWHWLISPLHVVSVNTIMWLHMSHFKCPFYYCIRLKHFHLYISTMFVVMWNMANNISHEHVSYFFCFFLTNPPAEVLTVGLFHTWLTPWANLRLHRAAAHLFSCFTTVLLQHHFLSQSEINSSVIMNWSFHSITFCVRIKLSE